MLTIALQISQVPFEKQVRLSNFLFILLVQDTVSFSQSISFFHGLSHLHVHTQLRPATPQLALKNCLDCIFAIAKTYAREH